MEFGIFINGYLPGPASLDTEAEHLMLEREIEFGVKLNAAAGAVIAKTSAEGHLTVKLTWSRSAST